MSAARCGSLAGASRTRTRGCQTPAVPRLIAAAVVFVCSAAILVLEILAGRLLAPYVGVTLETYTAIIGTVLAGIALGAWGGGWLADRVNPRRMLGPVVLAGGAFSIATVPLVRSAGVPSASGSVGQVLLLALVGFFAPAAVLAAVNPIVVKLQLRDLDETGAVVGRLSGIGTAGALVGTFVTGFFLVASAPTRAVIYGVGTLLVLLGLALWVGLSRTDGPIVLGLVVLAGLNVGWAANVDNPCDVESAYYCMRVERDSQRPSGRLLWLDDLRHSYVDLNDPTYLEFDYAQSFADVLHVAFPQPVALDALHIGGGGFTMPRFLAAEYPGTQSLVLELDPAVLRLAKDELGLKTGPDLRVQIGDARLGIRRQPDDAYDLVVGDAFASLSVPWHLTTQEFLAEVDRVLRPDGVYLMNVIDYGRLHFVRAEAETLRGQFGYVAVLGPSPLIPSLRGGNYVLVASDRPLDTDALTPLVTARGLDTVTGVQLEALTAGATVLTDDYAPVDQWLLEGRSGG